MFKDLKMSRQEIISAIDLEKLKYDYPYETNCYAFALGLDIPEKNIIPYAYQPGTISNADFKLYENANFKLDDIIRNVYSDLDYLHISYRKIDFKDDLLDDEWKIALFTSFAYRDSFSEFHFLRQLQGNSLWYGKEGYNDIITNENYLGKKMVDIIDAKGYGKFQLCLALGLKTKRR